MSGIYIHGMEMPKGLGKTITIYPDGMVRVWVNNKGSGERLQQRAVPVPQHGRLIDADRLAEEQEENVAAWDDGLITAEDCIESLMMQLECAPTIIPAEEAQDG